MWKLVVISSFMAVLLQHRSMCFLFPVYQLLRHRIGYHLSSLMLLWVVFSLSYRRVVQNLGLCKMFWDPAWRRRHYNVWGQCFQRSKKWNFPQLGHLVSVIPNICISSLRISWFKLCTCLWHSMNRFSLVFCNTFFGLSSWIVFAPLGHLRSATDQGLYFICHCHN